MEIGIAFDLKSDFVASPGQPDDRYEEFDSEATVEAIEAALEQGGHRPRRLGGGRKLLANLLDRPSDLVFNIAEGFGTRSREAHVPAVCEMLSIPYTHSDPLTLAASLDKAVAKRLVASCGVPTPRFEVVSRASQIDALDLCYPLLAKPLYEGSSMGIRRHSRASSRKELLALVEPLLADYGQPVLIEEFCTGPEFTVGILGTGARARLIGVMEVVPKRVEREHFVYSLEVKRNPSWHEEVDYRVPPDRPVQLLERVERVALDAFRALDCRDVARVDLRADASGEPRFLEINPLPGLKPGWSDLAILCDKVGLAYHELILAIVDSALERQQLRGAT